MPGQPHPPKTETFDLVGMTNTDPKGFVRRVEEYRPQPFGLYMARPTPGRAQFHYLESWLLPEVGLRISDFWYNPGHERAWDLYLDVVTIERGERYWVTRDLYLDIDLRIGTRAAVRDTDELLAAHRAGLVERTDATAAMDTALHTVEALAAYGYDLDRWLTSLDVTLTWRGR